jgi:hypothetical protein
MDREQAVLEVLLFWHEDDKLAARQYHWVPYRHAQSF